MNKKSFDNKEQEIKNKSNKLKLSTSWGNVASWYDGYLEKEGSYQSDLIFPNLIRLLNIRNGEKVIDIACGQGFFSRGFFEKGAIVTGVDISEELIEIAKTRSKNMKIDFFVSPADNLSKIKDAIFDKATIVLAIQDMENLSGVLKEANRVLKNSGEMFIVMNHPAFRIPKRSSWFFDEKKGIQSRVVDEYMSQTSVNMDVHPSTKRDQINSQTTISFHRPIQTYFKAFEKNGFVVTRLEEWVSGKESEPGPRAVAENKARREFPLFMTIVLKKNKD